MDVLALAQQHIELHKEGNFAYRSSCPLCGHAGGFVVARDNIRQNAWRYWLNCCGDRRGGDAADLAKLLRIPFSPQANATRTPPLNDAPKFDTSYWHKILHGTQRNLTADSEGGAYLLSRGLQPETWATFKLGYGHRAGQAALLIPWFISGHLKGGRYRLLNPETKQQRYAWWKGSETLGKLFGGHTHQQRRTLFIVEGEINAMSIYQVVGNQVDVLSTGSENATPPTNARWADSWDNVYCWFDKCERAHRWARVMKGIPIAIKEDANKLLEDKNLAEFCKDVFDMKIRELCEDDTKYVFSVER